MATTTVPAATDLEPAADPAVAGGKRKRRRLVALAALVVVLLAAGGYYLVVLKPAKAARAQTVAATEPGAVQNLDELTLNLSDGHFLRVGLALQLTKAVTAPKGSEGSAAAPAVNGARALDAAISILGGRTYHQLLAPAGRQKAVAALSKEVAHRYPGKVLRVYLTEFVMQ